MSRISRRRFLVTASTAAAAVSIADRVSIGEGSRVDTGNLRLWYTQPASQWVDALPIGNGRLGAMVFGGGPKDSLKSRGTLADTAEEPLPTDPARETLTLNEDTLWSGRPINGNNPNAPGYLAPIRDAVLRDQDYHRADELCRHMQGLFAEAYQPAGRLHVDFVHEGEVSQYRRELDLQTATATTIYEVNGVRFERTAFASTPDQAIVLRLTTSKPGTLNTTVWLDGALVKSSLAVGANRLVVHGKAPSHVAGAGHAGSEQPVVFSDAPGEGMYFVVAVHITVEGGRIVPETDRLQIRDAAACTLIVTAATGYRGFDQRPATPLPVIEAQALNQLDAGTTRTYASLVERHRTDYQKLFDRVRLDLGRSASTELPTDERLKRFGDDPDPSLLALYFQYGRYLLISSSRPGTQPANLQGIWNYQVIPPWSSNWTANINVEMNYWPAETCNLSECAEPLFDLIAGLGHTGQKAAEETYKLPGWVSHHNIDIWRAANPVGNGVGTPTWANWQMSGPWLCAHLYDHYLFTRDKIFLRDHAYPLMKGAAEFCVAWLIDGGEGHLTTCPSFSTENSFRAPSGQVAYTSAGCTMDIALIGELFSNCILAAKELDTDHEFAQRLQGTRSKLLPYKIGKYGQLQEWSVDFDESEPGQRHMSHLYPVYPGTEITPLATPALAKAARVSLERRLDHGGAYTGWSRAWAIALWARFGDGDKAWDSLKMLMLHSTNHNLFDSHPSGKSSIFQIDGNFGATAAIAEMLIQSHEGIVSFLPALPRAWTSGEVSGLRARGSVTIGVRWQNGKAVRATLRPDYSGEVLLRAAEGQQIQAIRDGGNVRLERRQDGTVSVRLEPGRDYVVNFA